MLTPQEVSSHAFAKAMMGGYNMAAVDEFLDVLTDDYTNLYKENAALKSKLKVLVEKVEDYRATEDSMRATLLTAQKMADSIVKEAEAKRDQMVAQAEADAAARIAELQRETAEAEARLRKGQLELAQFIAASREVCNRQLKYLEDLPEIPVAAPAAPVAEEKEIAEIEEKVMAAFTVVEEEIAEETVVEEAPEEEEVYPEGNPFEEEPLEATRRINLSELNLGFLLTSQPVPPELPS